jgi:hypothetical protein
MGYEDVCCGLLNRECCGRGVREGGTGDWRSCTVCACVRAPGSGHVVGVQEKGNV